MPCWDGDKEDNPDNYDSTKLDQASLAILLPNVRRDPAPSEQLQGPSSLPARPWVVACLWILPVTVASLIARSNSHVPISWKKPWKTSDPPRLQSGYFGPCLGWPPFGARVLSSPPTLFALVRMRCVRFGKRFKLRRGDWIPRDEAGGAWARGPDGCYIISGCESFR